MISVCLFILEEKTERRIPMNFMEKLFGKEKRSQQQNGSTVAGKSAGSKNEIGSPMEGELI